MRDSRVRPPTVAMARGRDMGEGFSRKRREAEGRRGGCFPFTGHPSQVELVRWHLSICDVLEVRIYWVFQSLLTFKIDRGIPTATDIWFKASNKEVAFRSDGSARCPVGTDGAASSGQSRGPRKIGGGQSVFLRSGSLDCACRSPPGATFLSISGNGSRSS